MQVLHEALRSFRPITVRLINYRSDRSPFVNDLTIVPLINPTTGVATHYLGVICERPLPSPHPSLQLTKFAMPHLRSEAPAEGFPLMATNGVGSHSSDAVHGNSAPAGVASSAGLSVPTQLQEALQVSTAAACERGSCETRCTHARQRG